MGPEQDRFEPPDRRVPCELRFWKRGAFGNVAVHLERGPQAARDVRDVGAGSIEGLVQRQRVGAVKLPEVVFHQHLHLVQVVRVAVQDPGEVEPVEHGKAVPGEGLHVAHEVRAEEARVAEVLHGAPVFIETVGGPRPAPCHVG